MLNLQICAVIMMTKKKMCDPDLGQRSLVLIVTCRFVVGGWLAFVRDAPSYCVLSCCEVPLNLLRWFLGCCWDTVLASGLVAALA